MDFITPLLEQLNYLTVMFLMFIESTFIPFPSEVVVPPAAYNAAAGELNIFLVVLFATIGADLGASVNYLLAYYLGRPFIYKFANSRWGHLCLLDQQKVERSEKFFYDHGITATLVGRVIPGIRQLISIPAGLAKMNFYKFILYTTIGAGIWNSVLAYLGYWLSTKFPEEQLLLQLEHYNRYLTWGGYGLALLIVCYIVYQGFFKSHKKSEQK